MTSSERLEKLESAFRALCMAMIAKLRRTNRDLLQSAIDDPNTANILEGIFAENDHCIARLMQAMQVGPQSIDLLSTNRPDHDGHG